MVTFDQCGWLGRDARVAPPPPDLIDLVEHVFRLDMRAATTTSWMIMPDAAAHLLVHRSVRRDGRMATTASLVGPRTRATEIAVGRRLWTVGVRIWPGTLPQITGLPAREMVDRAERFGRVWGSRGDRFEREADSEEAPDRVVALLLAFTRTAIGEAVTRDWCARAFARLVAETGGTAPVERLASRMGVSARSLRVRCDASIGLAPKRLARTERLYRAVELAQRSARPEWSRLATDVGYADQPHMAREFKQLLGESPTRFHRRGRRDADSFKPVAESRP